MKRLLLCLSLIAIAFSYAGVNAQNIIDSEDETNYTEYYKKHLFGERKAIPYAYLRENDVVWETAIWRSIDFREKFNQFFYFPTDPETNNQGRINLAYALLHAWKEGEFEAYEDDELKIPITYEKATTGVCPTSYEAEKVQGEDGEWYATGKQIARTEEFVLTNIYKIQLKEYWYIEKQDTRQKVRIVGLALLYNRCVMPRTISNDDEEEEEEEATLTCDMPSIAWIPMNDMKVRNILVKANVYDERNDNAERSYDDIFIDRYFDSYVIRESNRFNRTIDSYTIGEDAILLSQKIEDRIFDIESDMWEY